MSNKPVSKLFLIVVGTIMGLFPSIVLAFIKILYSLTNSPTDEHLISRYINSQISFAVLLVIWLIVVWKK